MSHTRAPYEVRGNEGSYVPRELGCEHEIIGGEDDLVLACVISECIPEAQENAYIFAAAPEMYEALKYLVEYEMPTAMTGSVAQRWEDARKALAKAVPHD